YREVWFCRDRCPRIDRAYVHCLPLNAQTQRYLRGTQSACKIINPLDGHTERRARAHRDHDRNILRDLASHRSDLGPVYQQGALIENGIMETSMNIVHTILNSPETLGAVALGLVIGMIVLLFLQARSSSQISKLTFPAYEYTIKK